MNFTEAVTLAEYALRRRRHSLLPEFTDIKKGNDGVIGHYDVATVGFRDCGMSPKRLPKKQRRWHYGNLSRVAILIPRTAKVRRPRSSYGQRHTKMRASKVMVIGIVKGRTVVPVPKDQILHGAMYNIRFNYKPFGRYTWPDQTRFNKNPNVACGTGIHFHENR